MSITFNVMLGDVVIFYLAEKHVEPDRNRCCLSSRGFCEFNFFICG